MHRSICLYIKLGGADCAALDSVDYYDRGLLITRINVPKAYRGQGHGRELLRQLLEKADEQRVKLFLEIQPSDGLTFDQLEAWYLRHGFHRWHGLYRRLPNTRKEKPNEG